MIELTHQRSVFFYDYGTKTYYEVEAVHVKLEENKMIFIGGRNHNELDQPREYPLGLDSTRIRRDHLPKV